jgi:hypothetical protein
MMNKTSGDGSGELLERKSKGVAGGTPAPLAAESEFAPLDCFPVGEQPEV